MNFSARLRILSSALLLALIFAAALPAAAFADEGEPPPVPAEEPAATEPAPSEPVATEEPAPPLDEATPTPELSGAESQPGVEPATDEPAAENPLTEDGNNELAEVLAVMPEGTELAVLDESGVPVPLASDGAAEAMVAGDPMWCPVGVTPGGVGCTISFGNLKDLVDQVGLTFFPAANGVIWITGFSIGGTDTSSGPIVFNGGAGGAWTSWSAYSLAFNGGWTGVGTAINTADPSQFSQSLTITGWQANVTLNNIAVTGGTLTGLTVSTSKNIVLNRVSANSNGDSGASLNNTSGTGSVTVTNSNFNGNLGGVGLDIWSNANVTLNTVMVTGNAWSGAHINNYGGTGSVSISNSSFNSNNATAASSGGLSVMSAGTITLTTVTASGNIGTYGWGLHLDNTYGLAKSVTLTSVTTENNDRYGVQTTSKGLVTIKDITSSDNGGSPAADNNGLTIDNTAGTAGVTFTGTNIFTDNEDYGVFISSNGAVKLNNVIANSNGYTGLYFANYSSGQPVTLPGTSTFIFNGYIGLDIISAGIITVNNITANSNGNDGAYLENVGGVAKSISITGSNTFNHNGLVGLEVRSVGPISAANITANYNTDTGVVLVNEFSSGFQKITLSGTNSFYGNGVHGVSIAATGAVTVNSVTAIGNLVGRGLVINNTYSGDTNSKQPVSLTGTNVFNENANGGLAITSYGNVTLNNVTANLNTNGGGVYVYNKDADTAATVTVNGTNQFNNNEYNGIRVETKGAIKLNNIIASGNGLVASLTDFAHGAYLTNNVTGGTGTITLTGTNVFSGNYYKGLVIESKKAVSLNSVTASDNQNGSGADINNTYDNCVLVVVCTVLSPAGVTITGTNVFNDNWLEGLNVTTYGAITLNSTTASGNGISGIGAGIIFYNAGGTIAKAVTLSGTNVFEDNDEAGISIDSLGAIKINNVNASNNGATGASLFNNYIGMIGGITLTGSNAFNSNYNYGLVATSKGPISVNGITANDNGIGGGSGNGADLYNATAATAQKVILTGTNVFNGNYGLGLSIDTLGAVSTQNLTAGGNLHSVGVDINNCFWDGSACDGSGAVTISGTNNFSNNYETGLLVQSNGAITINNVTAFHNGRTGAAFGYGVDLENHLSSSPQKVALTGTNSFIENKSAGLYIRTLGSITSSTKITASDNLSYGAYLDNQETGATGTITLSGSNTFSDNTNTGLYVEGSPGAVTVNNLSTDGNDSYGAYVLGVSTVTFSGTTHASDNANDGTFVQTQGKISLSSVTAIGNDGYGLQLINSAGVDGNGITLSGTNTVTDSGSYGVWAQTKGPVTINSITSSNNGNSGLWIQNNAATLAQTVKLTGTNKFEENDEHGLYITSKGSVTLNNITANNNGTSFIGGGVYIDNTFGIAEVTLTGTNTFNANDDHGLSIQTLGNVSVSKITADGNGFDGMFVGGPAVNLTITCGSFTNNANVGLYVTATGVITLKGVVASGNPTQDIVLFSWSALVEARTC